MAKVRIVLGVLAASAALYGGRLVAGESSLPDSSACDPLQAGVCDTIIVPAFCIPDLDCYDEIVIEINGKRT